MLLKENNCLCEISINVSILFSLLLFVYFVYICPCSAVVACLLVYLLFYTALLLLSVYFLTPFFILMLLLYFFYSFIMYSLTTIYVFGAFVYHFNNPISIFAAILSPLNVKDRFTLKQRWNLLDQRETIKFHYHLFE